MVLCGDLNGNSFCCCAGSMNAQAMACSSLQAIAASDRRHVAIFARVGAIPWLAGLVRQCPHHASGGHAAAALREMLQDQEYHVSTQDSIVHMSSAAAFKAQSRGNVVTYCAAHRQCQGLFYGFVACLTFAKLCNRNSQVPSGILSLEASGDDSHWAHDK